MLVLSNNLQGLVSHPMGTIAQAKHIWKVPSPFERSLHVQELNYQKNDVYIHAERTLTEHIKVHRRRHEFLH